MKLATPFLSMISLLLSSVVGIAQTNLTVTNSSPSSHATEGSQMRKIIGNSFKVNFGSPYIFKLHFISETSMSFTQIEDDGTKSASGVHGTVDITRVEIRPNVYMVYWVEPFNNNTTVTHVQDFENGRAWTNITTPGAPFVNLNGPLTPMTN